MSLGTAWLGNFLVSKLATMTRGPRRAESARTNNDIVIPRRETVSWRTKFPPWFASSSALYRTLIASQSDEPPTKAGKGNNFLNPGP